MADCFDYRVYFQFEFRTSDGFGHFPAGAVVIALVHLCQRQLHRLTGGFNFYRIRQEVELNAFFFGGVDFFRHRRHIGAFAAVNQVDFGALTHGYAG